MRPTARSLGAELTGADGPLDLRRSTTRTMDEIRRASDDHLVVFVRDQDPHAGRPRGLHPTVGRSAMIPTSTGMDEHPHVVRLRKEADEKVPVVFGGAALRLVVPGHAPGVHDPLRRRCAGLRRRHPLGQHVPRRSTPRRPTSRSLRSLDAVPARPWATAPTPPATS
ncbi:MAG: hypothetical protein R2695_08985 [Acidimicrobiales bacterium]